MLLWHGVGPDERDVLETLAVQTAGYGLTVVVPDWRSDAVPQQHGGGRPAARRYRAVDVKQRALPVRHSALDPGFRFRVHIGTVRRSLAAGHPRMAA